MNSFEDGLFIGMLSGDEQDKLAFIAQGMGIAGRTLGKAVGGTFRFAKNNPMTSLTGAFAVPGAISAGKRVSKSATSAMGSGTGARKTLLDPVTRKSPMGSIF